MPPLLVVETLTGNTGGPVGPTANNINVQADPSTGFTEVGNLTPSTLTMVNLTIPLTTNNNVLTTIFTSPAVTPGHAITVFFMLVGLRNDNAAGYWGSGTFGGFNSGAGFNLLGAAGFSESATVLGVEFQEGQAGNTALLQVVGEAAATYNWTATVRYIIQ